MAARSRVFVGLCVIQVHVMVHARFSPCRSMFALLVAVVYCILDGTLAVGKFLSVWLTFGFYG